MAQEKKQHMARKKERELAMRGIFQIPFHDEGRDVERSIERFMESEVEGNGEFGIEGNTDGYAEELIRMTLAHRDEIDDLLSRYLKEDWSLKRIPNAEKAILRLSTAEMLYMKIPKEIAINEAIELTKVYGDDDGTKYINGILNNLAKDHAPAEEK